jgi:hypothetical protein
MLDDVRFTIAAVAAKAYVQELTHFRIKDGRITGHDGVLTLSSPIGVDLDVRPNAKQFLAAVRQCEGPVTLHLTKGGRLCVRADPFKAFVDCLPEEGQLASEPEGEEVQLGEGFYKGVAALSPLMGVDASRPWAMGVKVHGPCLLATNNVMVGQYYHGSVFPYDVVIPDRAVAELLRVRQVPERVQVTPTTVTFHFPGDRWLKTALMEGGDWPVDRLEAAMDGLQGGEPAPLPDGFADALVALKQFVPKEDPAVYVRPGSLATSAEDEAGASVGLAAPLAGAPELACYSHKQLELLAQVATAVDWRTYPAPCTFARQGEPLRGLIVGRRM